MSLQSAFSVLHDSIEERPTRENAQISFPIKAVFNNKLPQPMYDLI